MILGIDTSNYTTSVAIVENNKIILDKRLQLNVKAGERGLRQSDAFYQHIQNMPILFEDINLNFNIKAVCVSDKPRRLNDSFMPCFTAGHNIAKILSKYNNIPITAVSHQEGHIQSGLMNNNLLQQEKFIAVHLSGGTTEILKCEKDDNGIKCEIIGGSKDISAGQFIDRVGVNLGFPFPCGKKLDEIYNSENTEKINVSVKDRDIYFAGNETKINKLINEGCNSATIASIVFNNITESVSAIVKRCLNEHSINNVLFAGGVSSGVNIRKQFERLLMDYCDLYFTEPSLCTDNAVGIASLGERLFYEK